MLPAKETAHVPNARKDAETPAPRERDPARETATDRRAKGNALVRHGVKGTGLRERVNGVAATHLLREKAIGLVRRAEWETARVGPREREGGLQEVPENAICIVKSKC